MDLRLKLQGKTDLEKLRFLYRTKENLRVKHNDVGTQFRNGSITEKQWLAYKAKFRKQNQVLHKFTRPIKEKMGLYKEAGSLDQALVIKRDGYKATDLDSSIDINTIK